MGKRRRDPGLAALKGWTKITEKPNSPDSRQQAEVMEHSVKSTCREVG